MDQNDAEKLGKFLDIMFQEGADEFFRDLDLLEKSGRLENDDAIKLIRLRHPTFPTHKVLESLHIINRLATSDSTVASLVDMADMVKRTAFFSRLVEKIPQGGADSMVASHSAISMPAVDASPGEVHHFDRITRTLEIEAGELEQIEFAIYEIRDSLPDLRTRIIAGDTSAGECAVATLNEFANAVAFIFGMKP